jgi:hypothetical protein
MHGENLKLVPIGIFGPGRNGLIGDMRNYLKQNLLILKSVLLRRIPKSSICFQLSLVEVYNRVHCTRQLRAVNRICFGIHGIIKLFGREI